MDARCIGRKNVVYIGLLGLLAGWGLGYLFGALPTRAKDRVMYPYLPERYSERYSPTLAEWKAMELSVYRNREMYLTPKLIQSTYSCLVLPRGMVIGVDTRCQKDWDAYRGAGRFGVSDAEVRQAYAEAARTILEGIRFAFPEIKDGDVNIHFSIYGKGIGVWRDGAFEPEE